MKKLKFTPKHGFITLLASGMLIANSCKKEVIPPPVAKNAELVLKDKLMGTAPLSSSFTSNDMQIIRELEYLNQKADADHSYSLCHGTARLGNIRFQGTMEHWMIQFDYIMRNVANHRREYYIPESSSNIWNPRGPGYADLVDIATKEIFEIKSEKIFNSTGIGMYNGPQQQAMAEIDKYVASAKKFCGGGWGHGKNFRRMSFHVLFPTPHPVEAYLSEMPGIVLYGPGKYTPPVNAPVVDREFSRKIANFFRQLAGSVSSTYEGAIAMDIQIKQFIIDNPRVKDYLKAAGIALIIATIAEDFATSGAGIADDWACYVIARNMWILSNATTVGAIANM